MSPRDFATLNNEIVKRHCMVKKYILEQHPIYFASTHLQDSVYSYIKAGGKSLRPAVLMFCCGAVGGDEAQSVPAAAAIEIYHTFTLVHDDIIDRDELRRGIPTVHSDFKNRAICELGFDPTTAQHYGLAIAILAGDMQQGWAASILPALTAEYGVPPELVLNLISELFGRTEITLINGETLDIVLAQTPLGKITEDQVIDMLRQKTGVLYEFAGRAGAAIGLKQRDLRYPIVDAIASFTGTCGTAFQIQDDILGIIGNEEQLGKPIGSDIREGKRTLILLAAWRNMTTAQREFTLKVYGNHHARAEDIHEVGELLRAAGGIGYAQNVARGYVLKALGYLEVVQESVYKELLKAWADYIVEREF